MKNVDARFGGFCLILPLIYLYMMTAVLLMTVHFIIERKNALQNLSRVEGELHEVHQRQRKALRHWEPVVDRPSDDKIPLSNRKKYEKHHHIFVDF